MQLALPFAPSAPIAPIAPIAPTVSPIAPTDSRIAPPDSRIAPTEIPLAPTTYFVRHSRARRYVIRVDADGRVRVTIPRGGSRREAEAFAIRQADWIARQQSRMPQRRGPEGDRHALREQARRELPLRLAELAAQFGLAASRVTIRNQRSRWGSCGREGHICLNWRLVLMPESVRNYVLVHELMHLRRMDHSPAYWRLVEEVLPDYRAAREWLRRHGPSLR